MAIAGAVSMGTRVGVPGRPCVLHPARVSHPAHTMAELRLPGVAGTMCYSAIIAERVVWECMMCLNEAQ